MKPLGLSFMPVSDTLRSALEQAMDVRASYGEIRAQQTASTTVTVRDGSVEALSQAVESGAAIRILLNGAWGFSSTNSLEKKGVIQAAKEACRMAAAASMAVREPARIAEVKTVTERVKVRVKTDPRSVDVSEKLRNLIDLNKSCFASDPRVRSVTVSYADLATDQTLVTSEGTILEQEKLFVWNYAWVTAKEDGHLTSARDEIGAHGYELFESNRPETVAQRVVGKALNQLRAKPAKGGTYPCVLGKNVVGVFAHEAVGHICEADLTLAGSAVQGMLGKRIAGEAVTIADSALLSEGFGAIKYDDEGVPGERTALIDRGVLVGLMHNRETAAKMSAKPTGNARAQDFRVPPLIRMRNTYLEPSDHSFEELLEGIDHGYYLESFRGGQANLDGTFTVGIQSAFEISRGELGSPVRNLGISGNTLATLREVEACGRGLELEYGRCGKGQFMFQSSGGPPVRVRKILVGGTD